MPSTEAIFSRCSILKCCPLWCISAQETTLTLLCPMAADSWACVSPACSLAFLTFCPIVLCAFSRSMSWSVSLAVRSRVCFFDFKFSPCSVMYRGVKSLSFATQNLNYKKSENLAAYRH